MMFGTRNYSSVVVEARGCIVFKECSETRVRCLLFFSDSVVLNLGVALILISKLKSMV